MIKVILGVICLIISFALYCCLVVGKREDEFLCNLPEDENNVYRKDEEE